MEKIRSCFIIREKKIFFLLISVLCFIIYTFTDRLYSDMDNYGVAQVTNGLFGSDHNCQFLHPFFCFMLGGLKKGLPYTDVFTAFSHLLLIIGVYRLFLVLYGLFETEPLRMLLLPGVIYLQLVIGIWNVNYTVWAAFFCLISLLVLFKGDNTDGLPDNGDKDRRIRGAEAALWYGIGYMMRWQAALLFLPFFILETVKALAESRKKALKILPLAVLLLILIISRTVFYSGEPYRSSIAYDNSRIKIGDFPLADWEDIYTEAEASGISNSEYESAKLWIFADTEIMNTEKFRLIGDVGSVMSYDATPGGILACLYEMSSELATGCITIGSFALILLIMLLAAFSGTEKMEKLEALAAFLGGTLILFYMVMKGRCPVRVWYSVEMAVFGVLVLVLGRRKKGGKNGGKNGYFFIIGAVLLIIPSLPGGKNRLTLHSPATAFTAMYRADNGVFQEILDSDRICLVGGFYDKAGERADLSFGIKTDKLVQGWEMVLRPYMDKGKLPPAAFFRHFIPCGFWYCGQPYFREVLTEDGIENPIRSLIQDERVCFLCFTSYEDYFRVFAQYLYDHYGNMDVEEKDGLLGAKLFSFSKI